MNHFSESAWKQFREALGLRESPLGIYYTNDKPEGVTPKEGMKEGISGCMIGLLQSARKKGKPFILTKVISDALEVVTIWGSWKRLDPISNISYPVESQDKWRGNAILRHRNWRGNILER